MATRAFLDRAGAGSAIALAAGFSGLAALLSACGSSAAVRPDEKPPAAKAPDPLQPKAAAAHPVQDLTCEFVGLEMVEDPAQHADVDSVSLLAVYRFPEQGTRPAKDPLSLKFQVSRSRVEELRDFLATRPEVVCSPDENANYSARVEPFDNVRGVPQR